MHGMTYTSPNGYRGVLYGERSMAIFDPDGREVLNEENRILAEFRDALLPELMSGRIEVKDNDQA